LGEFGVREAVEKLLDSKLLARYSFALPNSQTDKGCIERTSDEIWWRRLIRKEQKWVLDYVAREWG